MADQRYYITTPIYYVNDVPHIGHAYTTIAADVAARFKRLAEYDVFFLTGTDEHGLNIERIAKQNGVSPEEWTDKISESFKDLWSYLGISYDDFIRTTEPRHERVAAEIFRRLHEKGDIYRGVYEGWYCTSCESFYLENELGPDRTCPIHTGRKVEWISEESYIFKLSKYADWLLERIEAQTVLSRLANDSSLSPIEPEPRRNEVVSFIRQGLKDISVSRSTFTWGIPVPFDPRHVIYVWIDALTNYISALGYLENEERFRRFWPATVHLVGKEIVRFHAIYWPAILHASGLEVPRQVFGHGWLTFGGKRFSKSLGIVIDPRAFCSDIARRFGIDEAIVVDALRFFLLREIPFGGDGDFNEDAFLRRYNSDLANDYGNLVSRVLAQIGRHFQGLVPEAQIIDSSSVDLRHTAETLPRKLDKLVSQLQFSKALDEIWNLLSLANRYLNENQPWKLVGSDKALAGSILTNALRAIRVTTILLSPWLPSATRRVWNQLGLREPLDQQTLADAEKWDGLLPRLQTNPTSPVFPRINIGAPTTTRPKAPVEFDKFELDFLHDYFNFASKARPRALTILDDAYRKASSKEEKHLIHLLAIEQFGLVVETFEGFFLAFRDRKRKSMLRGLQRTFDPGRVIRDFENKTANEIYLQLNISEAEFTADERVRLRRIFEGIIETLKQISPHNKNFLRPALAALKHKFLVYRDERGVPKFLLEPSQVEVIDREYANLAGVDGVLPEDLDYLVRMAEGFEGAIKNLIALRLIETGYLHDAPTDA